MRRDVEKREAEFVERLSVFPWVAFSTPQQRQSDQIRFIIRHHRKKRTFLHQRNSQINVYPTVVNPVGKRSKVGTVWLSRSAKFLFLVIVVSTFLVVIVVISFLRRPLPDGRCWLAVFPNLTGLCSAACCCWLVLACCSLCCSCTCVWLCCRLKLNLLSAFVLFLIAFLFP